MPWLHPILGTLAVLLVLWVGWQGLTARQRRPEAGLARRRHRQLSAAVAWLAVLSLLSGVASVVWLREDMDLAVTWHFRLGLATGVLAVVAWLLSRGMHKEPVRKGLHLGVGLGLMAAAIGTALLGIEFLP